MLDTRTRKLTLAGIFVAAAVLGGVFSFPVLGSRCAPMQHLVNILAAVFLGPLWGIAEAFGTGLLGALAAYPVAAFLMGLNPASYTVYIVPFLISTGAGSILAYLALRFLLPKIRRE